MRTKKKGKFYILYSPSTGTFKFGATTKDIDTRKNQWNYRTRHFFYCVYECNCSDVFGFECKYKWKMWENSFSAGEFIIARDEISKEVLIKIAEELCTMVG